MHFLPGGYGLQPEGDDAVCTGKMLKKGGTGFLGDPRYLQVREMPSKDVSRRYGMDNVTQGRESDNGDSSI